MAKKDRSDRFGWGPGEATLGEPTDADRRRLKELGIEPPGPRPEDRPEPEPEPEPPAPRAPDGPPDPAPEA